MMLNKISAILFIVILTGCGISKVSKQPIVKPEWVLSKPVQGEFYIGVGSAIKNNDGYSYMKKAKENALASLASEISLNISSQSVLHQYENSVGFSEDFQNMVQTSSRAFIEGYEQVAIYDDGIYYWVYYRLSKQTYQETKQRRMDEASGIGLDYLQKAEGSKSQNNMSYILHSYLKGLEAIKPFWGESLLVQLKGQEIYLGNELYNGVVQLVNQIKIKANQKEIEATAGGEVDCDDLVFHVSNERNVALSGIPILFYANSKPVKNNKAKSDAEGNVRYCYSNVPLGASNIIFKAKLDLNAFANSLTQEAFFRKMLRSLSGDESSTHIQVKKPTFYVKANGSSPSGVGLNYNTELVLTDWFVDNNYPCVKQQGGSDYTVLFSSKLSRVKQERGLVYFELNASVEFYDNKNTLLSTSRLPSVEGVHNSSKLAAEMAFNKMNEVLSRKMNVFIEEALE